MRGLKQFEPSSIPCVLDVASFTDAWIETVRGNADVILTGSHLLQMRGLKLLKLGYRPSYKKSHLLQMRGLKRKQERYSFPG